MFFVYSRHKNCHHGSVAGHAAGEDAVEDADDHDGRVAVGES